VVARLRRRKTGLRRMQWDAASSSPGMRIYRLAGECRGSAGVLGHEAIIIPQCDTPEGAYSQARQAQKTTDLIPIYFLMAAVRETLLPTYLTYLNHSTQLASTSSFATSPSIHPSIHPLTSSHRLSYYYFPSCHKCKHHVICIVSRHHAAAAAGVLARIDLIS
jgi:hypothetical protein